MASPPASTKTSLGQRLRERARQRWPQLAGIDVRFRGQFAYVTGKLPDGSELPLCRLRYGGYASTWGFAIYRASHDDYQDSFLPSGQPAGTPEEALDCACGLYLGDPTAWLTPPGTDTPTDLQAGALAAATRCGPRRGGTRRVADSGQAGYSHHPGPLTGADGLSGIGKYPWAMFSPHGPSVRELAMQALASVEGGYDLLAPKFDHTPFRTPRWRA